MLTVILLAGGFGTRIREIHPDVPKPMIPVAGRPFLEWALRYWKREGASRVIVSLGHLAHVAEAYLQARPPDGLEILTVTEPHAMGTGGAVRFAAAHAPLSDPFAVANADSLIVADTRPARDSFPDPSTDGALLGVPVPDASRYGALAVSPDNRLLGFREKQPGAGLINAGVYFFRPRLLPLFAEKTPLSLEVDVFPALLAAGAHLRVLPADAPFLDIGTPESLREAEEFVRRNLA